jgi:hypothetical protein
MKQKMDSHLSFQSIINQPFNLVNKLYEMFSQCLLLEPSHFTTWVKQKVPQTYPFNLSNQVYTVSTQSLLTKPINYKNKNILQLVITIQTNPLLSHVLQNIKMDM